MPRYLSVDHAATINKGRCAEITTLILDLKAGAIKTFTASSATDFLTSTNHGLANDETVLIWNKGGLLPKPLQPQTTYFVTQATANTFKLTDWTGNPAIDITWDGLGVHYYMETRQLFLSTKDILLFGTHQFLEKLHPTEGLELNLSHVIDNQKIEVTNVDKAMGLSISGQVNALDGAIGLLGTVHRDLDTLDDFYTQSLNGDIRDGAVSEDKSVVSFQLVSDLDTATYQGELISEAFPFREIPDHPPTTTPVDNNSNPRDISNLIDPLDHYLLHHRNTYLKLELYDDPLRLD